MLKNVLFGMAAVAILTAPIFASNGSNGSKSLPSMAKGVNGYEVSKPLFTVGESINGYTPPGILDGLGATKVNKKTVRVFANHELLHFRGYPYELKGNPGLSLTGARVSYFDIDVRTKKVKDSGLAYDTIYAPDGSIPANSDFLGNLNGFSRFCSSALFEAGAFNKYRCKYGKCNKKGQFGLEDTIYFTGEEDGGFFNSVGGIVWALDVKNKDFWAVPAMGRGAWENITQLDTGSSKTVAFLLADDTSPFDFDPDQENGSEASPLYLYIGKKDLRSKDFLKRNGLKDGKLYVFVPKNQSKRTPAEFNTKGFLFGKWVEIDNSPSGSPSVDGSTGFDQYGYPTQGTLWLQARDAGAFGFSRPEDVSTSPYKGNIAVLASTGVDTYVDGADTFGTLYNIYTDFKSLKAIVRIFYDGDADPKRALRSPDNLDWSADGFVYVQEDEAEEDTLDGEPLFGDGAANPNEAGIVKVDPYFGKNKRIANVDRDVVLDASIGDPTAAVDVDAGDAGEWESSGILDVSKLFGKKAGSLFIFNIQAHGIEDQDDFNADSRINDGDLVEGGQLLFLNKKKKY